MSLSCRGVAVKVTNTILTGAVLIKPRETRINKGENTLFGFF